MQLMRILLCGSLLLLSACNSIERRLDLPNKKPLAPITNAFEIKKAWNKKIVNLKAGETLNSALTLSRGSQQLFAADTLGNIVAVDLDGVVLWKTSVKESLTSGPSLFKEKVCVVTGSAKLICLNTNKGEELWNTNLSSESLAGIGFSSSTTGDLIFVHTIDGGLSAIKLADGRQLWRFSSIVPNISLRRGSAPVVFDNYVVAGFSNGKLFALNKEDGSIFWSQNISNPKGRSELQRMIDISADPVIVGNTVYAISYQGNLTATTLNDGALVWEREVSSYSGLMVDHNSIYISAIDGKVFAVDKKTGTTLWIQEDLIGRSLSKPVIFNNYIVIGDLDGNLHFLDQKFGAIKARV